MTIATGEPLPARWQRIFAFQDRLESFRKGDRIEVRGHFRRRIEKPTSIVEFVVLEARLAPGATDPREEAGRI